MDMQTEVGNKVRVKRRQYNWHGNDAVGTVTAITVPANADSYVRVVFGPQPHTPTHEPHEDLFNLDDVSVVDDDTPLTPCPADSPCVRDYVSR